MTNRRDIIAETLAAEFARTTRGASMGKAEIAQLADAIEAALLREDKGPSGQPDEGRRPEDLNAENDG